MQTRAKIHLIYTGLAEATCKFGTIQSIKSITYTSNPWEGHSRYNEHMHLQVIEETKGNDTTNINAREHTLAFKPIVIINASYRVVYYEFICELLLHLKDVPISWLLHFHLLHSILLISPRYLILYLKVYPSYSSIVPCVVVFADGLTLVMTYFFLGP